MREAWLEKASVLDEKPENWETNTALTEIIIDSYVSLHLRYRFYVSASADLQPSLQHLLWIIVDKAIREFGIHEQKHGVKPSPETDSHVDRACRKIMEEAELGAMRITFHVGTTSMRTIAGRLTDVAPGVIVGPQQVFAFRSVSLRAFLC